MQGKNDYERTNKKRQLENSLLNEGQEEKHKGKQISWL